MPRYDYKCSSCGQVVERKRAVADRDEPVACPDCPDAWAGRMYGAGVRFGAVPGTTNNAVARELETKDRRRLERRQKYINDAQRRAAKREG